MFVYVTWHICILFLEHIIEYSGITTDVAMPVPNSCFLDVSRIWAHIYYSVPNIVFYVSATVFAIRWEMAKILLQNTYLTEHIKKNKRILTHTIKTACFLSEECPTRDHSSPNDLLYGVNRKLWVKPKNSYNGDVLVLLLINLPTLQKWTQEECQWWWYAMPIIILVVPMRCIIPATDSKVILNSVK